MCHRGMPMRACLLCCVRRAGGVIDTVIMNPPFGARVKGVDMAFVKAAIDVRGRRW